jgi:hypothetical protein
VTPPPPRRRRESAGSSQGAAAYAAAIAETLPVQPADGAGRRPLEPNRDRPAIKEARNRNAKEDAEEGGNEAAQSWPLPFGNHPDVPADEP